MAQGIYAHHARLNGLDVEIDSAGTAGFHVGKPPDSRAIQVAASHGIDIAHFKARQVTQADFYRFDQIYVMDQMNHHDLMDRAPQDATAQIGLVLSMDATARSPVHHEVPDPYYGDLDGFYEVFDLLNDVARLWADAHRLR